MGEAVERYADMAREILAAGHDIGMHSYTHTAYADMDRGSKFRDLKRAQEAIKQYAGRFVTLFRPPHGVISAGDLVLYARLNITTVLWSVDPGDSRYKTAGEIMEGIKQVSFVPGDIVLMHDDNEAMVDALPFIITRLRCQGFSFVTVGAMLK